MKWYDKRRFPTSRVQLKKIIVKSFATEKLSIFFLWNIIIDENRNGNQICLFLSPPNLRLRLGFRWMKYSKDVYEADKKWKSWALFPTKTSIGES